MENEKIFADGFIFKRKDTSPDFVIGNISVKVDDAINFLKTNMKNGWVNMNIKKSKAGNFYMELDTWEPKQKEEVRSKEVVEEEDDGIPF